MFFFRLTEVANRELKRPLLKTEPMAPKTDPTAPRKNTTAPGTVKVDPSAETDGPTPMVISREEEEEEEDQPLDMSRTSRTISHTPRQQPDHAHLFSGLHLLVDTAVGLLEAQQRRQLARPALA